MTSLRSLLSRFAPRRVTRAVKRRLRKLRPTPASKPSDLGSALSADRVVKVAAREIGGTLDVAAGASPVKVSLFVNDIEIDHVDVPPVDKGPAGFRFPVKDMWQYCGPQDRITVRVGDDALPMPDGSSYHSPTTQGKKRLSELRKRLAAGEIVNSQGGIALPKYLDTAWQASATTLYRQVSEAVHELVGYEPFLVYGSLLGAVREGRPLGHDCDFDAAYLSKHTDPALVTKEAGEIALALQQRGFSVEARVTCIHISNAERTQRIDLYHFYFDDEDTLRLAWGSVSEAPFQRDQWDGLTKTEFAGATVSIPRGAEQLVEKFYGPNWRVPNPGFSWTDERTDRATEAYFPAKLRPVINWQDFWIYNRFDAPSSFADNVCSLPLQHQLVVDLGCGDGRDAGAFLRSGSRVLGLDSARSAIESAHERHLDSAWAEFEIFDFGATATGNLSLASAVESRRSDHEPVLYYARQLLDSISNTTRTALLTELADLIQIGDSIAFEFRGLADNTLSNHEQWSCGRRTVDVQSVRDWLENTGMEILLDQEGTQWERQGSKRPYLHRLIARKSE